VTTAATIWVNTAAGMAAGAGYYAMAAVATGITLVVLAVLARIEAIFEKRVGIGNAPRQIVFFVFSCLRG
jgi:uncharacterized membrane protein YhiD involved in acid resistance